MADNDKYRGHRSRAFVIVGGKPLKIEEYDMTINNKGESGSCSIKIPLDNIDPKTFEDDSVVDNLQEVQVWCGYIEDGKDEEAQLKYIYDNLKKQTYFTKRFDGFVSQPEIDIGETRYLHLSCLDWTGLLRDYKFYATFEDGATECRNVIKTIQKDIKGIELILDDYSGVARLGQIDGALDSKSKKQVYHSIGKTYWEIIHEVADKLGRIIIVEGSKIRITGNKSSPHIWPLYYGPRKDQKDADGVAIGQYFKSVKIRYGQKGRIAKSNVVVEATGTKTSKRGHPRYERAVFPDDHAITSVTEYVHLRVPGNVKKEQLKIIAENEYRKLSKRLITCTIDIPFANNFMQLWDLVEFVPDALTTELNDVKGMWFEICSITERYGMSGLAQTIEVDSNSTLEKTVKVKPNLLKTFTKDNGKKGK